MISTRLKSWLAAFLLGSCAYATMAQNSTDTPEWVEDAVGDAPAFSPNKLLPIEMPPYVSLKVGVDPATITLGKDGVVRYVVVMSNATGSMNAAFEGIRCATGEVKTYARQITAGQWSKVASPQWKSLTESGPSRHAYMISRQGACNPPGTPGRLAIIEALKNGGKNY